MRHARIAAVLWLAAAASAFAQSLPQTIAGRASVIDGDTIEIHGTRIRLFGIDAPESGQLCWIGQDRVRCGQRAAFALADKIGSNPVECHRKDVDRYGRIVAVCTVGREDLNAWMVTQGWTLAYRRYSTAYVAQEEAASRAKRGMWQGDFDAPGIGAGGRPISAASAHS